MALGSNPEKPLHWIGSSKKDLLAFPEPVKDTIGYALGLAQLGGKHPAAKPWRGLGPGVFEVVDDFDTDTYRAVYAVRFDNAVYVLHAFQKKAKRGGKTPQQDIDLIAKRLKRAREDHEVCYGKKE